MRVIIYLTAKISIYQHNFVIVTGFRKRLAAIGQRKVANHILMKWVPAPVDHLHHVVSNSPPGQLRREWWMSGARHICNVHNHDFESFPECRHGPHEEKYDKEGVKLVPAYLKPGTLE